ncbi:hypothetical protein EG68_01573 [Paragonimus skrjabini miyazakii]|uniref:Uncharacterized protein n=1 Tax=Paragonimus skrjabini miyazakii TaxID=59628 RepID=A0A8S9ZAR7_9TREM|nr:hypothetical protein EG68_01573 [Paragonimus skrjabini miyazakii]
MLEGEKRRYAMWCATEDNPDARGHSTAEILPGAFYVDGCLMSVSTAKDTQVVILLPNSILLKDDFRSTKSHNNVKDAVTDIPTEDLSSVTVNVDQQQTEAQKTVGVFRDRQCDNMCSNVSGCSGQLSGRLF